MSVRHGFRHPVQTVKSWSGRRKLAAATGATAATAIAIAVIAASSGAYLSFVFPKSHLHGTGAVMSGTSSLPENVTFDNLQPGADNEQFVTFTVKNDTGTVAADVWLTFPNKTGLSTINNLGTYGHADITVTRGGVATTVFSSDNLNDREATCGTLNPSGCWPVPQKLKVASDLKVGQAVKISFGFNYAGKMKNVPPLFNEYPVPAGKWSPTNPDGQTYVDPADGSGDGLDIQPVFMQVGHDPS